MTSSTLHFRAQLPGLTLKLLLIGATTLSVCAYYTVRLNPEIRFFVHLSEIQGAWSEKMEREHTNKVVVFGGSSCIFSINGEQMLRDFQLPTVNRGLAAGMGLKIPALNALEGLKSGDTLIVALEPSHLTGPIETTSLAAQFSHAVRHPDWITTETLNLPGMNYAPSLLALRPGSQHFLTLIGKLAQGRQLYRYQSGDIRPSGWVATNVRTPVQGPPGHGSQLSDDVLRFLPALRDWCGERGIRVAYSLPWAYCPEEKAGSYRQHNAGTLLQIARHLPVLRGANLGADPDAGHFADTAWHLTESASQLRTAELGKAIKEWDVWRIEELEAIALDSLRRAGKPGFTSGKMPDATSD